MTVEILARRLEQSGMAPAAARRVAANVMHCFHYPRIATLSEARIDDLLEFLSGIPGEWQRPATVALRAGGAAPTRRVA